MLNKLLSSLFGFHENKSELSKPVNVKRNRNLKYFTEDEVIYWKEYNCIATQVDKEFDPYSSNKPLNNKNIEDKINKETNLDEKTLKKVPQGDSFASSSKITDISSSKDNDKIDSNTNDNKNLGLKNISDKKVTNKAEESEKSDSKGNNIFSSMNDTKSELKINVNDKVSSTLGAKAGNIGPNISNNNNSTEIKLDMGNKLSSGGSIDLSIKNNFDMSGSTNKASTDKPNLGFKLDSNTFSGLSNSNSPGLKFNLDKKIDKDNNKDSTDKPNLGFKLDSNTFSGLSNSNSPGLKFNLDKKTDKDNNKDSTDKPNLGFKLDPNTFSGLSNSNSPGLKFNLDKKTDKDNNKDSTDKPNLGLKLNLNNNFGSIIGKSSSTTENSSANMEDKQQVKFGFGSQNDTAMKYTSNIGLTRGLNGQPGSSIDTKTSTVTDFGSMLGVKGNQKSTTSSFTSLGGVTSGGFSNFSFLPKSSPSLEHKDLIEKKSENGF